MTTDVLALREALLRDIHTTFCERSAVAMRKYTPQVTAHQVEALVSDRLDALIAAVRAETLEGSGVVSMAAVQKAVGILRDYSHGEECAVYAEDDDLVDVYDDPTNEACDCGLRDLILTLTGALPDVGATALALVATPPTPVLTAARLAEAMREQHRPVPYHWSQSGESGTVCAGSIVGLHHRVERWPCDVESAILAALATPTPGGTR